MSLQTTIRNKYTYIQYNYINIELTTYIGDMQQETLFYDTIRITEDGEY